MRLNGVLAAVLLAGLGVHAQVPGAGAPAGMTAAMIRLFGDITAFTAKAEMQVLDESQKELNNVPMDFAMLNRNLRVEIDLAQMKSQIVTPDVIASFKQMGMAQVVSVFRMDQKQMYVIYPESKAMMDLPLPKAEADAAGKTPKLQKTALGKETVDGHPCVKNKVLITYDKGQNIEATTWNATDLKDFPVQIRTQEGGNTSFVRFKQVQFAKPDPKQFEPPAGYTQYKDQMELMQAAMKKKAGGEEKK